VIPKEERPSSVKKMDATLFIGRMPGDRQGMIHQDGLKLISFALLCLEGNRVETPEKTDHRRR
jgi:hypothetical protein